MNVIGNYILDKKVESRNYLLETNIIEYYEIAKNILKNNEFQRPRVPSSLNIYSLLRDDLKNGCLMPPLVLALPQKESLPIDPENIINLIEEEKNNLIILDGLQRTYSIQDLINELKDNKKELDKLKEVKLRVELYYNISRCNVLYRMLTLNTGHTQMSTRHQIEIVYSDLQSAAPKDITILRDTDRTQKPSMNTYKYNDLIDGFTSFLENDYLTIQREDILDSVKKLKEFNSQNNERKDLFYNYIHSYNKLANKFQNLSKNWCIKKDDCKIDNPYGKSIPEIFSKSQTLTGFGAAISALFDAEELKNFADLEKKIEKINIKNIDNAFSLFNSKMDFVYKNKKKIGNDQRLFLYSLFLKLLTIDSKFNFESAINQAVKRYERETM